MIKFLVNIVVDGVEYKTGDAVPEDKIPAGSLEMLYRQQRVEKIDPAATASVTVAELQTPLKTSAEQPGTAAKRK
jgi:hypothetical protein